MNDVVTTLAHSFLIGSLSRMGLKFSRIGLGTDELPALERLEKTI